MNENVTVDRALARTRAVAILRLRDHSRVLEVGRALLAGGLDVMELTLDADGALKALDMLAGELGHAALLGAGTVTRADQARQAAALGARFCVSPGTDPDVIRAALDSGAEPVPGAATATEVSTALRAGARFIKLFPAGPLGIGYLRALRGPFRDVKFIPTGGIGCGDVRAWLGAGAAAVGLGADLVPPAPGDEELAGIARKARIVASAVQSGDTAERLGES